MGTGIPPSFRIVSGGHAERVKEKEDDSSQSSTVRKRRLLPACTQAAGPALRFVSFKNNVTSLPGNGQLCDLVHPERRDLIRHHRLLLWCSGRLCWWSLVHATFISFFWFSVMSQQGWGKKNTGCLNYKKQWTYLMWDVCLNMRIWI